VNLLVHNDDRDPNQRRDPASLHALPHLSDRSGRAALRRAVVPPIPQAASETTRGSALEVFAVALCALGASRSFGGPIAHLGYFRTEYVQRRAWLDEATYADLVALAQLLPGAASSKVGISIGVLRAGLPGGLAAWLGFTLPSAIAMIVFALSLQNIGEQAAGWLHGLKIVAVAAVAFAVWGMARNLAWDRARGTIALASAAAILACPDPVDARDRGGRRGIIGWRYLPAPGVESRPHVHVPLPRWLWIASAALYFVFLVGLPVAPRPQHEPERSRCSTRSIAPARSSSAAATSCCRSAAGGRAAGLGLERHVPRRLRRGASRSRSAVHAVRVPRRRDDPPAERLGRRSDRARRDLPAVVLPRVRRARTWSALRSRPAVQATLRGVNAAVVGVLLAALYTPVITTSIFKPIDAALALVAFAMLAVWRIPPWIVVLVTAAGGALIRAIGA
jgi:chromate transporter